MWLLHPEPCKNPSQTNGLLKFSFLVTHNLYIFQYGCICPETMVIRKERDHLHLRVLEEQPNVLFVSRPQLCSISQSHLGEKVTHSLTPWIHKWRCRNIRGLQAHFRPKEQHCRDVVRTSCKLRSWHVTKCHC